MRRRHFLELSAGIGFAFALGAVVKAPTLAPRNWALWSALDRRSNLVEMGRHCVEWLPGVRSLSVRELSAALNEKLGMSGSAPVSKVGPALISRVSLDFSNFDAEQVDGWYLSTTEILLAVLAFRLFDPA